MGRLGVPALEERGRSLLEDGFFWRALFSGEWKTLGRVAGWNGAYLRECLGNWEAGEKGNGLIIQLAKISGAMKTDKAGAAGVEER